MNQLLIVGAAAAALVVAYNVSIRQAENRGATQERARVIDKANKTDAKAQTARTAAVARPDSVLSRYCRDCGKSGSVQIVEAGDGEPKGPSNASDSGRNRKQ